MGNIGAATSQKGYDVRDSDDRFKVFSSSFQTLKIYSASEVSATKPASGANTITINHNLGYYAPYIIIYNGSTSRGTDDSFFFSRGLNGGKPVYSVITNRQYTNKLEIDVEDDFDDSGTSSGDTVYFTVYIFLDDFYTISQENINTDTTSTTDSSDYGLRISKDGYDVKTTDDVNCVISSSYFTQIVHRKGIVSGLGATVSHDLGYLPDYLCYIKGSGNSYINFAPLLVNITTTTLDPGLLASETAYYVILKSKLD